MNSSTRSIQDSKLNQYVLIDNIVQKYNGDNFQSKSLGDFANRNVFGNIQNDHSVQSVPNFNLNKNIKESNIKVAYPLKIIPAYPLNIVQPYPIKVMPIKNNLKLTNWNDQNIKNSNPYDFNDQYAVSINSFQDKEQKEKKTDKQLKNVSKDQFISPSINVKLDILENNKKVAFKRDEKTLKNTSKSSNTVEYESKKRAYRIATIVILALSCLLVVLLAVGLSVGLSLGLSSKSQVTIHTSSSKSLSSFAKRIGFDYILNKIESKFYSFFCDTNSDCPGSSLAGSNGSFYVTMTCSNKNCICLFPYEKVVYKPLMKCVLPNESIGCKEDIQCEGKCIEQKCYP